MGRPLTGKKHVGIRRDTRPNGDVYVYERVTGYDAKTQKTKTIVRGHYLLTHFWTDKVTLTVESGAFS